MWAFRQVGALKAFAGVVGSSGRITGVDIDPAHVASARTAIHGENLTNIEVVDGSILGLPFGNATFDVILCRGVLHEVRELNRAFCELARVVKPDGRIVIIDFARFSRLKFALYRARHWLRGKPCMDVHPGFSRQSLGFRLEANGLCESSYQILPGEWRMGFIRSNSFLLVALKTRS